MLCFLPSGFLSGTRSLESRCQQVLSLCPYVSIRVVPQAPGETLLHLAANGSKWPSAMTPDYSCLCLCPPMDISSRLCGYFCLL